MRLAVPEIQQTQRIGVAFGDAGLRVAAFEFTHGRNADGVLAAVRVADADDQGMARRSALVFRITEQM